MRHLRLNPGGVVSEREYARFVEGVDKTDRAGRLDRYPDLQPAVIDEHFPHFDTAVENHEMWHKKDVAAAYRKNVSFPPKMVCVGHAEEIVYLSDKWEKHADFYSYVHGFDSHPEVYADASRFDGTKAKSTAKLLGVKSVGANDRLATPILARVAEFIFVARDGNKHVLQFDFPPLMLCSPDKVGLLILSDQMGPIVVRGGQMEITARGIVK